MYEPVIFKACNLVTLIQTTKLASDTAAAAKQAIAKPSSGGLIPLLVPIKTAAVISATTRIFHRASDATPSENMDTKT